MKAPLRRILLAAALLLAMAARLGAADAAPVDNAGFLDSFIGGTWTAALPDNGGTIELVFTVPANHVGIHIESTMVAGGQRRPYVSGMYAWNSKVHKFQVFYTDSSGAVTRGQARVTANGLVYDLYETNADGTEDAVSVKLTRDGPDAFTNEIKIMQKGAFVPVASVRYVRAHQP